ncbi:MAG: biotin synthase BioB [Candidatus Margulisbacteria bacterium]|nr:biotin synthase BioB [Candidatus Margulisiibacteriota bacterium]
MDHIILAKEVINGKALSFGEASNLINTDNEHTFEFLAAANRIKQHYKANKVKLCAIINAKSGKCSENCCFCAQSAQHKINVECYPLMTSEAMTTAAKEAEKKMQATCFSIVTSGKATTTKNEMDAISTAVINIKNGTQMNRCVSIGTLSPVEIKQLKEAGLTRLHHNLETAESFFDQVCTTHTYAERLETIKAAKQAGIEVCSGGIFGLGESLDQRIELAFTLRELGVVSVPINILNPIPGTPAAKNYKPVPPLAVLRLIATYRFILPSVDIGVFGGREKALGSLQPLMFLAGANVTLIGDYLTTKGQAPVNDLQMIEELGLEIAH